VIALKYSLVIEATADPNFFGFSSSKKNHSRSGFLRSGFPPAPCVQFLPRFAAGDIDISAASPARGPAAAPQTHGNP
jgi:hypothetical protein